MSNFQRTIKAFQQQRIFGSSVKRKKLSSTGWKFLFIKFRASFTLSMNLYRIFSETAVMFDSVLVILSFFHWLHNIDLSTL